MYQIVNENVLEFSADIKYHAVISDPPYGLAFMNKGWDSFKKPIDYQKWVTGWSSHLMQYLYPGAVCVFFGGTRTYHRLAVGLEDSGYEIFDSMIWCYGSGFPKSYNISKGIDKSLGLEREIVGYKNIDYPDSDTWGTPNKNSNGKGLTPHTIYGDKNNIIINGQIPIDKPNSDLANNWNGYGTALKPAYEPIVLCRKPLEKGGYVNSALKYGTSGLNIDGGRIGTDNRFNPYTTSENAYGGFEMCEGGGIAVSGRFPANFGLICECEKEPCECIESELNEQSGLLKSGELSGNLNKASDGSKIYGNYGIRQSYAKANQGGASRFFYTAKASSKERELGLEELELQEAQVTGWSGDGMPLRQNGTERKMPVRYNNHPTVKPIKLIEYLAKLLLPPIENSSILIPFSGVGSEMIGSCFAGWNNITGVEIDKNYVAIANKRLDYWTKFDSYQKALKSK